MARADAEALLKAPKDTLVVTYAPWCQFCQGMEEELTAFAASTRPLPPEKALLVRHVGKIYFSRRLCVCVYTLLIRTPNVGAQSLLVPWVSVLPKGEEGDVANCFKPRWNNFKGVEGFCMKV